MPITITTNNVPRDLISGYQLSADERAEFDYIDWAAVDNGEASPEFFRYKGDLYDLGDLGDGFETTTNINLPDELKQWDGYQSDSFFSGLVIRWPREGNHIDFEAVIVGRYCS